MIIRRLEGTPEQIATAGAMGCFDTRSSATLLEELQDMQPEILSTDLLSWRCWQLRDGAGWAPPGMDGSVTRYNSISKSSMI
jgi:hypothetical protein